MGRLMNLISWEINEHLRVLVTVIGIIAVAIILQHGLLTSTGMFGTVSTSVSGLPSMSGMVLVRAATSSGLWITLSFFTAVLAAFTFRSGIEGGYELTLYSLPYRKYEIFLAKLFTVFLLSLSLLFVPMFVLIPINFADTPGFVLSLFTGERFIVFSVLLLLGILYIISVTIFLAVSLRSMLAALVVAFPVLVTPYLLNANLPPSSFLSKAQVLALVKGHIFLKFLPQRSIVLYGIVLPGVLILTSLVMVNWRDVK
ncbi:hypothetical protein [Thermococcus sp. Bubb.Bath]|uniref:hypothetical protein n=1 Tax=Thermococcus sp. Bubb.Bath TaxID=1638242 RepID=UPI00143C6B64|nr:hypothetical protein [Thermococcus sp. Bubb.Bath]NJF25494.1 hypothetical protein [Thermococcus sp. Bubb.Bath]